MEEERAAFYDVRNSQDLPILEVAEMPVLFRLILMRYAVNGKLWEVVGNLPLKRIYPKMVFETETSLTPGKF